MNPVEYAETTLGVHTVWERAEKALADHKSTVDQRVAALRLLRTNRAVQADREYELASENRGKYSELSDTAFTKALKQIIHDDPQCQDLREKERGIQADLDAHDAMISHLEIESKILSARMSELAGLLSFYGATKIANTQVQHVTSP